MSHSGKLKILLLSPCLPSPDGGGCARKVYDYMRLLHQRGHGLYLFSFCSDSDKEKVDSLKRYCAGINLEHIKDYSAYPGCSVVSLRNKVLAVCLKEDMDILQCEKAYMCACVPPNLDFPLVLVEHEVLSAYFWEKAQFEGSFINKAVLYARAAKKLYEQSIWYKRCDSIVVFSQEDKDIIRKFYDTGCVEVIPLGISLNDYPLPQNTGRKTCDIIFTAHFAHSPNVDAALYFCKRILPVIREAFPDVSVKLAGAVPPPAIKRLGESDRNILVTGHVRDIRECYSDAKVFIAPVRYGRGMRYKILEALSLNMPVVATTVAARGFMPGGNIKIADSQNDFAEAVTGLLSGSRDYDTDCSCRAEIENRYNWDLLINRYESIYDKLLG